MEYFLQQLINGLTLGAIYGLIAIGYTMVYGIIGMINFAHGEIYMLGAFISLIAFLAATTIGGTSVPIALLITLFATMILTSLWGWTVERVAYRPLRGAPRLAPLISAIGVSIVLQNLAMMIWGREYHAFPQLIANQSHHIAGAIINDIQIIIIIMALVIMLALMAVVHRTRLGRAMRAVAENQHAAQLMGVDVNRVISVTFMLGSALAAIAGLMVSVNYGLAHYYMGFLLGLKAFTAAVLGGIGNLRGAMLGGLLLGLIESLGAGYIGDLTGGFMGSQYQDVFAFFVLIAVLVFRPSGLLGERLAERA